MKHIVAAAPKTKTVPFMTGEVEVRALSVRDVKEIDKASKAVSEGENFDDQFEVIKLTLRLGVIGAEEMTDEDFENLPMKELTVLSEAVLDESGLSNTSGN